MIYLDAQSPTISKLRWWELLSEIKDQAAIGAGITLEHPLDRPFTERTAISRMKQALSIILDHPKRGVRRLLIVIDEVEHLVPDIMGESHWNEDFLPFWKFLRALQTEERRITFLIAGVNPSVSERPSVGKQDNPLFSLLGIRYLPSFSAHEAQEMVQTLGKRMGILFDGAACEYLTERYGGHPMLIRLACSWEHRRQASAGVTERPVQFTVQQLSANEQQRELALLYYTRHVLDVLKQWYPAEYELLELLAQGDAEGFREFASDAPESVEHLRAYGLLRPHSAELAIAMVGSYMRLEAKASARAKRSHDHVSEPPIAYKAPTVNSAVASATRVTLEWRKRPARIQIYASEESRYWEKRSGDRACRAQDDCGISELRGRQSPDRR